MDRPVLYWISGSSPAWRVMLGLVLKGIAFESRHLDHGAGENKAPAYLALNPKGQVPTLVAGNLVIRESLAIVAWLDRAYRDRPIFGNDPMQAATVWQDVAEWEGEVRPHVAALAGGLIRGRDGLEAPLAVLGPWLDGLATRLEAQPFLGGAAPMANDIWLYPSLRWIARGVQLAGHRAPEAARRLTSDRPALVAWDARLTALPGVAATHPPHWSDR